MDFTSNIKQLRQQYHQALKQYYNDKHILFKMLYHRIMYDNLCEVDWALRTCMIYEFSDKRINYLLKKRPTRAVEELRNRAMSCLYTVWAINYLINNTKKVREQDEDALDLLKQIRIKLCNLAEQDINHSNEVAATTKSSYLPLERLNIDELRK